MDSASDKATAILFGRGFLGFAAMGNVLCGLPHSDKEAARDSTWRVMQPASARKILEKQRECRLAGFKSFTDPHAVFHQVPQNPRLAGRFEYWERP
jgi:hypothetical protein